MRSPVGASDFIDAVQRLGSAQSETVAIAKLLGFDYVERVAPPATRLASEATEEASGQSRRFQTTEEPMAVENPAVVVLAPTTSSQDPSEPEWWSETTPLVDESVEEALSMPVPSPLFDPSRQRDIVRRMLEQPRLSRRVDVPAMVRLFSRHEPFREVPRLRERVAVRPVAIVVDSVPTMDAYRQDVAMLVAEMQRLIGRGGVIVHSQRRLMPFAPRAELVVVVSDLRGPYAGRVGDGADAWIDVLRSANNAGVRTTVLVPGTVPEAAIARLPTKVIEWSRATRATHLDRAAPILRPPTSPWAVLRLATALALAVRVEPALVRAMRLGLLPNAGPEIEGTLRSTKLVDVANAMGFAFRKDVRAKLMRRLERSAAKKLFDASAEVVERIHASSPEVLRLEEKVTRLALGAAAGWQEGVTRELRAVTRAIDENRSGLARWVDEASARFPAPVRKLQAFAEAAVRSEALLGRPVSHPERGPELSTEVAKYLRRTAVPGTEPIAFAVEMAKARGFDSATLEGLAPEDLRTIAERLHAPIGWLHSLRSRRADPHTRLRYHFIQREVSRARGELVTRIAFDSGLAIRERIAREKGFQTTVWEDKYADAAVVVNGTNWLPRLKDALQDPGFIVCKIQPEEDNAAEYPSDHDGNGNDLPNVVSIGAKGLDEVAKAVMRFASFAERGSRMRVVVRHPLPSDREEVPIVHLPRGLVSGLEASSDAQAQHSRSTSSDGFSLETQCAPLTIRGDDQTLLLTIRPLPRAWVARLWASTCRIRFDTSDGRRVIVTGSVVARDLVCTVGIEMYVGMTVVITFGDVSAPDGWEGSELVTGVVERIEERIAAIRVSGTFESFRWLQPGRPPSETGAAMALAMINDRGPGHLAWGQLRRRGANLELLLHQRNFDPISAAAGAPVIVENQYIGHVVERAIQNGNGEGGWVLPVALTPFRIKSGQVVTPSPEPPTGTAYENDVYVSYSRQELPAVAGELTSSIADATERILGRQVRFLRDTERLVAGEDLSRQFDSAVLRSRFLLAFVTPSYFQSEWCRREWASFAKREVALGRHLIAAVFIGVQPLPVAGHTQVSLNVPRPIASEGIRSWLSGSPDAIGRLGELLANLIRTGVPPFDDSYAPGALEQDELRDLIVAGPTAVPVPPAQSEAATGAMTDAYADALAYAHRYDDIRARYEAGLDRTNLLIEIVNEVHKRAEVLMLPTPELRNLFQESDGGRLVTLVLLESFQFSDCFALVEEAVRKPRSAFEAWHALKAALRMRYGLSRAQWDSLRGAVSARMSPTDGGTRFDSDEDLRSMAERIIGQGGLEPTDVSSLASSVAPPSATSETGVNDLREVPYVGSRHVFISHSSEDREAALRIATKLRANGIRVVDGAEVSPPPVMDPDEFRRRIRGAAAFIAVLSKAAAASRVGEYRFEWLVAADLARTDDLPIIGVVVDDLEVGLGIPPDIAKSRRARARGGELDDSLVDELRRLVIAASGEVDPG
jgi:hypothetical protein